MKKSKILVRLASFLLIAAPGLIENTHCPFIIIGEPKVPEKMKKM